MKERKNLTWLKIYLELELEDPRLSGLDLAGKRETHIGVEEPGLFPLAKLVLGVGDLVIGEFLHGLGDGKGGFLADTIGN